VLTHSPTLHASQARSFTGTTLAKAGRRLDDLAATLARGKTRRGRDQVTAEIAKITHDTWVREAVDWRLDGDTPAAHRLTWSLNQDSQNALEERVSGKRILITDHEHWPVGDVVAAYRSQSEIEFGFRQLKDPHDVSFSPMHHWTEHNITVHTFTCVLALCQPTRAHIRSLERKAAERALCDRPSFTRSWRSVMLPTRRGGADLPRVLASGREEGGAAPSGHAADGVAGGRLSRRPDPSGTK
jgi:hypothetical protein